MSTPPTTSPTLTSPPPPPVTNATTPPPPSVPSTNSSNPVPLTPPYSPPSNGSTIPVAPPATPSGGSLPPGALAGLIVGIVIGGLGVLFGVGIFVFFYKRKKRKAGYGTENYSGGRPQVPKDDQPQRWQQGAPSPTDHKITIMPKPAPPPGVALHPLPETPSVGSRLTFDKPLPPPSAIVLGFSQSTFTYEELASATDNFSKANLLGQGGFGYVHKGVLPDGKAIAIKQLKAGSGQGEREFQAEVDIISRVHHRHLVALVGYCISGAQRLLVYEFVSNNTLEFHLHGEGRPIMDWPTRIKIAVGSAKGLAYLHEDCHPKIIHRDIKAANILLDDNFEAKVADFGLAKYSLDTDTHVSTRVMGTFGYLAPEYASSGKLTEKSDVFSFGVVLLELITGRRPVDRTHSYAEDSIVDWVRPLLIQALEDGKFDAFVDPRLQREYDSGDMARMVACTAACVRHSAKRRPRMSQIVRALEGNMPLDELNEGVIPGHSSVYSSFRSSDYNSRQYKEDLKKFKKIALESQEHGTSEYSGPTSDSGLNQSSSSTEGQQSTQEAEVQKMDRDLNPSSPAA